MTKNIKVEKDDERQALIDGKTISYNNNDHHQRQASRLEWAESSWIRYLHVLFWWWVKPLLSLGYKQSLSEDNLDDIPYVDKSSVLLDRLNSYDWTSTTTSKIVIKEFWKDYTYTGLSFIFYLIVRIAQPLLIRQIILNIMNQKSTNIINYLCVIGLLMCAFIHVVVRRQNIFHPARIGIRIRNALSLIIYTRTLSMKSTAWKQLNIGQIINLISSDASKFEEACKFLHYLWEGPLETLIIFVLLCWIMKPMPTLCGYALFPFFIFLQLYVNRKFGQYRERTALHSDERIHAINEFINGSYIVKMYNWEKLIEDRIQQIRQNELTSIKRTSCFRTINTTIFFMSPPLLALATFGSAWVLGYSLNPADTFATLSYFSVMRINIMSQVSTAIEQLTEVKFASKRIDSFMRLIMNQEHRSPLPRPSIYEQEKGSIIMSNAFFSWNDDKPCLSSLNLNIEPNTLVGIVGPVGSDTLRNNILLNRPFDKDRYRNTIHACCLDVDLSLFGDSGDLTVIGDKGVNLSGGQKARVSLARALYADADIYLLDDPLASVDSIVAKQIYKRCIGSDGLLKHKTRLLVTHHTDFLNEAHQTIFLSHGHIDEHDYLDKNTSKVDETSKNETSVFTGIFDENKSMDDTKSIITAEVAVSGGINWSLWYRLFTASPFGIFGLCLLIVLLLLAEILNDGGNYWLSLWVKRPHTNMQRSPIYAYVYFGLIIATLLADIVRVNYYYYIILHGSNSLYNNMLRGLLYTSIQFFENNPSGRILNRASKDQQVIDESLPITLLDTLVKLLLIIGLMITICFVNPYISLLFIVLIPLFWLTIRFYLRSSRQLKRLESVTRSPVYALFSSSFNGLSTIRAFKAKDHFIQSITNKIDANTCSSIYVQGAAHWVSVRLEMICCLVILGICIQVIFFPNGINASTVGLSLTSAISLTLWFPALGRQIFEVDNLSISAERINEYTQLPSEEDEDNHNRLVKTSPEWPAHGTIEFRNYSLRHQSNLEYAIKNINLRIESGQKIGVIGRTGAGKSSLLKGMFRFVNQANIDGQILIDDVDISRIALNHLRSQLSVIPQQPILFSGTLRYNLDPFNLYTDEQCWMALEDVQLKQFVSDHLSGLLMPIGESGNNLSVGQCQLICIARAILKKTKILLIDEATANIDQTTDDKIQTMIAEKFQDRTVLTIAHRLKTVDKNDLILVLDKGVIMNYDIPTNVLHYYR